MRVLLVDDDQLIRFVHQMFIERAGHEVVGVAEEETQAVRMALELKPDVVVMDITGKTVYTMNQVTSDSQLNLSSLQKGQQNRHFQS